MVDGHNLLFAKASVIALVAAFPLAELIATGEELFFVSTLVRHISTDRLVAVAFRMHFCEGPATAVSRHVAPYFKGPTCPFLWLNLVLAGRGSAGLFFDFLASHVRADFLDSIASVFGVGIRVDPFLVGLVVRNEVMPFATGRGRSLGGTVAPHRHEIAVDQLAKNFHDGSCILDPEVVVLYLGFCRLDGGAVVGRHSWGREEGGKS